MQVSSVNNQNFGARLAGDFDIIKRMAVKSGFRYKRANEIERGLKKLLPDDCTISFFKPQEGTVTGRVVVENWKGSGVDMDIRPVFMNRRNVLVKYKEAAEALASVDFSHNKGLSTIA